MPVRDAVTFGGPASASPSGGVRPVSAMVTVPAVVVCWTRHHRQMLIAKPAGIGWRTGTGFGRRRNADLEARRISVSTENGCVTFTGSIASWAEHEQAQWAARSAPGVTAVQNNLLIAP